MAVLIIAVLLMAVAATNARSWSSMKELNIFLENEYSDLMSVYSTRKEVFSSTWDEELRTKGREPDGLPRMWPSGLVSYWIDPRISPTQKHEVLDAMQLLEEVSCVKFRPNKRLDSMAIQMKKHGCQSDLGYQPQGIVTNLGEECFNQETIVHELLHALGMPHQQSASNRDKYIVVHKDNIQANMTHNFRKREKDSEAEREFGYDLKSIMHYPSYSGFEIDETRPTMTNRINPYMEITPNTHMSRKDILKLNRMYNCIYEDNYIY